jgi:SecD/SecF fusion protein
LWCPRRAARLRRHKPSTTAGTSCATAPSSAAPTVKNPRAELATTATGRHRSGRTSPFDVHRDKGRKVWQNTTREIAQRGQGELFSAATRPPRTSTSRSSWTTSLISAPYINFQENPDGIDGRTGSEISGGFTIKSAQRLANLLKSGALPIRLENISASQVSATLGQQA